MELDLQATTGSVIKPVFNAAKRVLDTGRVEITETTLTIRGNGPANVAAIQIKIDLDSTFTSVTTQSTEYDWDFSQLWDVFREGRKTDRNRLSLKDPLDIADWETIDDLPGIGRGEREVLEANGITTPRQLKEASTAEIIGSTEYTYENYRGEEETNEAEIEADQVASLKRPFTPVIVVEINGEDPVDSDRPNEYPRERPPEMDFQFPDELETGATVTVNGRDFLRALRPAEQIDSMTFLGATDTDLILHSESDTETIWANPDSSVEGGQAGGWKRWAASSTVTMTSPTTRTPRTLRIPR